MRRKEEEDVYSGLRGASSSPKARSLPRLPARGARPGPGAAPSPLRLMIYAQDGLGLGHMRRTTSIAAELIKLHPDAVVLTVEDSPLGNFFRMSPNHDYVKLPSIEKLRQGDWRAVNLPLRFEDVRAMREQLIRSLALNFRPDILLVDHMPHGAMGELRVALEALRDALPETRLVLGLRDIIDAPEVIVRRWQVEGAYEALERFYDLVLVYGSRDVFDLAQQYRLPPKIAKKVRYCGYLCTPAVARYPERIRAQYTQGANTGTKLVVAMAGGGADAYPMMRAVLDALPALRAEERVAIVLITGPFMPSAERRKLQARAAGLRAQVRITVSDPLSYIDAADLIVARAGYNTTTEILRSSTPVLLIPRPGPSAEQRTRARLFAERGWVDVLDQDDMSDDAVTGAIVKGLRRPRSPRPLPRPELGGLRVAVEQLVSLLAARRRGARLAPTGG